MNEEVFLGLVCIVLKNDVSETKRYLLRYREQAGMAYYSVMVLSFCSTCGLFRLSVKRKGSLGSAITPDRICIN
jgi:hypothetical protein